MNRKRVIFICVTILAVALLSSTALAIDEAEVEQAIIASSEEAVAGNLLVWFLPAVLRTLRVWSHKL